MGEIMLRTLESLFKARRNSPEFCSSCIPRSQPSATSNASSLPGRRLDVPARRRKAQSLPYSLAPRTDWQPESDLSCVSERSVKIPYVKQEVPVLRFLANGCVYELVNIYICIYIYTFFKKIFICTHVCLYVWFIFSFFIVGSHQKILLDHFGVY